MDSESQPKTDISFLMVTQPEQLPGWATREILIDFFHETMKPTMTPWRTWSGPWTTPWCPRRGRADS